MIYKQDIAVLYKTFHPDKGGVFAITDINLQTKFYTLSMKTDGVVKFDFS